MHVQEAVLEVCRPTMMRALEAILKALGDIWEALGGILAALGVTLRAILEIWLASWQQIWE